MKKYVAPASCVLSVKMDENIAYSIFQLPVKGDYIYDADGKIQNTPLDYTTALANASNPFGLFLAYMSTYTYDELTGYLKVASTSCYVPPVEDV